MKKILIMLLAGFLTLSVSAQYKVIVNESNAATSISAKEVSHFLLKKSTKWSDGSKVQPVDQKAGSSVRQSFTQDVHGKNVGAIKSYWQQAVFSGKGTPPAEKASDAEVIAFVKGNPGAIGYVSASASVSGVKVITIN